VQDALGGLGLSSLPSSNAELHKAFRRKAKDHHPDRGGDPNSFQQLVSDFDMLSSIVDGSEALPEAYVRVNHQNGDVVDCTVHHLCPECRGEVKKVICPQCQGRPQACSNCRGLRVVTEPCLFCGGTKLAKSRIKLSQAELASGKINVNGMLCLVKVIESD